MGDQLNLLGLPAAYFTANPDYEDPAIGITGRWTTFGLNMPDADTTPAAPLNLFSTKRRYTAMICIATSRAKAASVLASRTSPPAIIA